jgi:hypothetical protein
MLTRTRIAGLALCLLAAFAAPVAAGDAPGDTMTEMETPEISQEYEAAILQLMQHTGVDNIGEALKQNILQGIQRSMPGVDPERLQELAADIDTQVITDQMIATYAKHLTQEEVEQINAFLATPAGRKYIETQPIIIREGIEGTQQWAQQIYTRIIGQIQSEQAPVDDTTIMPDAAPAAE